MGAKIETKFVNIKEELVEEPVVEETTEAPVEEKAEVVEEPVKEVEAEATADTEKTDKKAE